MKTKTKDIIILTILLITLGISIVMFFTGYENKTYQSDDIPMIEWISPDGVHYWLGKESCEAYMAPRYDKNGELVIDK